MLSNAPQFPSLVTLRISLRAHFRSDRLTVDHRKWVPRCLSEFVPNKTLRVIEIIPWDLGILVKAKESDNPQEKAELEGFWAEADRGLSGCGGLERFTIHPPRGVEATSVDRWNREQLRTLLPISMSKGVVHFEQKTGTSTTEA